MWHVASSDHSEWRATMSIRSLWSSTLAIVLLSHILGSGAGAVALCDSTSKGLVPLTELGTNTYKTYPGGLYPDASNTPPAAHLTAGVELAEAITPLDSLGVPSANGRIVLL